MNKLHNIFLILFSLTILIYTGCSSDTSDNSGEDYLLAGYYMIAGDEIPLADDSRATAPVHQADYSTMTFDQWIAAPAFQITNYPERHQKTYITVTATAVADVYFVSSRTEYPNKGEIIDYYLEEYYVKDEGDGIWNNADSIIDSSENVDPYFRTTMEVHFKDGSIRKEWIDDIFPGVGYVGTADYQYFPIDGDMTIPADDSFLTSDSSVWSSKVYYYQKVVSPIGYFDIGNIEIFGVRYYSQFDTLPKQKSSTLAYEKVLSRTNAILDTTTNPTLDSYIFGSDNGGRILAQTVVRENISENGKKDAVTRSVINTKFGISITVDKAVSYDL